VLAAATDGESSHALDEALAPESEVRFDEPMSPTELADYVVARLDGAAIPDAARRRFDATALARLHEESEGLPGALHRGATAQQRGAPPPPAVRTEEPTATDQTAPTGALQQPLPPEPSPEGSRGRSRQGLLVALLLTALGLGSWILFRGRAPEPPLPIPAQPETASPAGDARARVPFAPDPDSEAAAMLDGVVFDPGPSAPTPQPASAEPRFTVHLNATPWAEIELDGRPLGVTPLAAIEVEPGRHRFRARMADGRILQRDVVLSPERQHLAFE
jgi:hypothetical protein